MLIFVNVYFFLRSSYTILLLMAKPFKFLMYWNTWTNYTLAFVTHNWMYSMAIEEYTANLFHQCASTLCRGSRRAFPALHSHHPGTFMMAFPETEFSPQSYLSSGHELHSKKLLSARRFQQQLIVQTIN